ncbi:MAG TPA: MBL fold metallo-hydrolase [Vicinamibacterales bacterium]|nr:MBL fold metallo-hydrolase [Vicinamibacterales bacterium]
MSRPVMSALAFAASVSFATAQTATPLRLYVFDGGILESDPGRYDLTKEDVGETRLSVACYLVAHPRGLLMWDTCAVPDAEWKPTGQPVAHRLVLADGRERRVTLQSPLEAQLKATQHRATDVTHLALSHYHWDHTANANAFAGATWLVAPVEREAMFVEKLAGSVRPPTYARLRTSKSVAVTAAEHDVFGDGAVVLKQAPGHTPGHLVLYLKLAKTGAVVLSGDLYHYPQERTMNRYPNFEVSVEQTRASRSGLDAFLKRTGAQLWIQHDLTAHAKLRKAPQFYE